MYASHWGLRESPFRNCLDPQLLLSEPDPRGGPGPAAFPGGAASPGGAALGPDGSGKSFLLEVFAAQFRRGGRPAAKVNLLAIEPAEMLWLVALELGLNPEPTHSTAALWRMVTDRLLENRYQQIETAILLDDADQASREVLAQVARLAQYDCTADSRLTLVLAGQQEQIGRVGDRLLGLAELRIDIEPWEQAETENYLKTSLAQAGCEAAVFAEPAVARLQELSQGIPRRINQLADLALLAGAGQDLPQIDAEVVESAYRELGVAQV